MGLSSTCFRTSRHLTSVAGLLGLLLLPATCLADELFIPDSSNALNLQADNAFFVDSAFALDNAALYQAADNLRNNSMSSVQRQLNHQWLQTHTHPDKFKPTMGGRAVNQILKMGWETYREQNKRNSSNPLLRYTKASHGRIGKSMDYDVRISDDKFRVSLEYEF